MRAAGLCLMVMMAGPIEAHSSGLEQRLFSRVDSRVRRLECISRVACVFALLLRALIRLPKQALARTAARVDLETRAVHNLTSMLGIGAGRAWTKCKTCVFMIERIKKGTNMLLPAICSELYLKYPDSYTECHGLLKGINLEANNIRFWLFEGCYKYELYEAKEWIKVTRAFLVLLHFADFCRENDVCFYLFHNARSHARRT